MEHYENIFQKYLLFVICNHHELPFLTSKWKRKDTRGRGSNRHHDPLSIVTVGFEDSTSAGNSFLIPCPWKQSISTLALTNRENIPSLDCAGPKFTLFSGGSGTQISYPDIVDRRELKVTFLGDLLGARPPTKEYQWGWTDKSSHTFRFKVGVLTVMVELYTDGVQIRQRWLNQVMDLGCRATNTTFSTNQKARLLSSYFSFNHSDAVSNHI